MFIHDRVDHIHLFEVRIDSEFPADAGVLVAIGAVGDGDVRIHHTGGRHQLGVLCYEVPAHRTGMTVDPFQAVFRVEDVLGFHQHAGYDLVEGFLQDPFGA